MDAKARIKEAANGFWDAPLGGSFRELDEKIAAVTASGYNDIEGGRDDDTGQLRADSRSRNGRGI